MKIDTKSGLFHFLMPHRCRYDATEVLSEHDVMCSMSESSKEWNALAIASARGEINNRLRVNNLRARYVFSESNESVSDVNKEIIDAVNFRLLDSVVD